MPSPPAPAATAAPTARCRAIAPFEAGCQQLRNTPDVVDMHMGDNQRAHRRDIEADGLRSRARLALGSGFSALAQAAIDQQTVLRIDEQRVAGAGDAIAGAVVENLHDQASRWESERYCAGQGAGEAQGRSRTAHGKQQETGLTAGQKGWSPWADLNRRPLPYQGSALPLSYMGIALCGARILAS